MKHSNMLLLLLLFVVWSCMQKDEEIEQPPYQGPLVEADSIETLYSDSAVVVVKVKAPKQYEYQSGDSEYPQGIYIEFFEKDGSISSTLKADKGYYFREQDRYTGVGNIIIEGIKENNRLETDTLHWSPPKKRVYTKANVMVIQDGDTLYGQGLEAAQDFSTYEILNPVGVVELDEEEEEEEENEQNP